MTKERLDVYFIVWPRVRLFTRVFRDGARRYCSRSIFLDICLRCRCFIRGSLSPPLRDGKSLYLPLLACDTKRFTVLFARRTRSCAFAIRICDPIASRRTQTRASELNRSRGSDSPAAKEGKRNRRVYV